MGKSEIKKKNPRNEQLMVRVSPEEKAAVSQRMEEAGFTNLSQYLRKMALNGYCVRLDLQGVKETVRLLRYCSNNLNQYAKKANQTGNIYRADIEDLQERLEEIWDKQKEILVSLSKIP